MEHCPRGDLFSLLQYEGVLSLEAVRACAVQMVQAIECIHLHV